jgi:Dolichyl-phosphate-mannose-protein mannosyltransferase
VLALLQGRLGPWTAWVIVGCSAGLGVLNKLSIGLFLASAALALVVSRHRTILFTRQALLAVLLAFAVSLPFLYWQTIHEWPLIELLRHASVSGKNVMLTPFEFVVEQIKSMNPAAALVWVAGLAYLLRIEQLRWLATAWLTFFLLTIVLHAKTYYVAPAYPFLFAAGGVAWESLSESCTVELSAWMRSITAGLIILVGLLVLPLALPVLSPDMWLKYVETLHLDARNTERQDSGLLPQFYADRFGWSEEVAAVTRIVDSLSADERDRAVIFASNYGEASALLFLGKSSLPPVISTQNNYWLWGPQGSDGGVVILIDDEPLEVLRSRYASCELGGRMGNQYAMPYENRSIYVCRDRHRDLSVDWPTLRNFS